MTRCCLSSLCCGCCCSSRPPLSICDAKAKAKAKAKKKHQALQQLHVYGVLSAQVVASAVLVSVILWLFIRLPDPQVHVTGLDVDGVNKTNDKQRTLLHFNFTLHNPDLYKSIHYDVCVLRITYSGYRSRSYGATVNFDVDGKGIHQRPGETTLLSNHTVNYTDDSVGWLQEDMLELKTDKTSIYLRFVMEIKFMALGRVMGTRQMMRTADIYFDDNGNAFIDRRGGQILK